MVLKLAGLVKRGDVWIYRRAVPPKLRAVVGASEVKRTLGTGDLDLAQERWRAAKAKVERSFAEGRRAPSSTVFPVAERSASRWATDASQAGEKRPQQVNDSDNPPRSATNRPLLR